MTKDVLVFLPKGFTSKQSGFLKGFCKDFSTFRAYYILGYEACCSYPNYIGYVSDVDISRKVLGKNTIYIKSGTQTLTINDEDVNDNITQVLYDLNALENNHDLNANGDKDYGVAIQELVHALNHFEPQPDGCDVGIFIGTILYLCNLFTKVTILNYPDNSLINQLCCTVICLLYCCTYFVIIQKSKLCLSMN